LELDGRTRSVVARRHPSVSGYGAALVVAAAPEVQAYVIEAVGRLAAAVNGGGRVDIEQLVDDMVAAPGLAGPLVGTARREAGFRMRVLREHGSYSAAEVAERAGAGVHRRTVHRWRAEGRVLAVPVRGATRYLGFQFDEAGMPLPVVAEVLAAIGAWPQWQIAMWFVTGNRLLDQAAPVALLTRRPAAVVAAARRDARAAGRAYEGDGAPR
jgi:hypothetical protein